MRDNTQFWMGFSRKDFSFDMQEWNSKQKKLIKNNASVSPRAWRWLRFTITIHAEASVPKLCDSGNSGRTTRLWCWGRLTPIGCLRGILSRFLRGIDWYDTWPLELDDQTLTVTCRKRHTVPFQNHFYWPVFGKWSPLQHYLFQRIWKVSTFCKV